MRKPVDSSNIAAVGWDPRTMVLEVEFHHGGVYHYLEVPKSVYGDFIHADSIGKHFHKYIRPTYSYRKAEEEAEEAPEAPTEPNTGRSPSGGAVMPLIIFGAVYGLYRILRG